MVSIECNKMEEELVDSTGYPLLDAIIHYGLFVGAVFQLICIFAVIFVPKMEHEQVCGFEVAFNLLTNSDFS